jgi:hypothetical protein
VFAALGASVNDDELDPKEHAAGESSYALDPNGTATGNVTFYPKVNSLVISDKAYAKLDGQQRDVLAKAAAQTRDWTIKKSPSDADAAEAWCHEGRSIVLASPSQLAALQQATAPVAQQLEQDGGTAKLIAAIRDLGQGLSAPAPPACRAPASKPTDNAKINGVYEFKITDRQLRAGGITDAGDIAENHGKFTMSLKNGEYCWTQTAPNHLNNPDECSTYEIRGSRVVWNYPTGAPDVYGFAKLGDGDLKVTAVRAATPAALPYVKAWAANTWERIGGGE